MQRLSKLPGLFLLLAAGATVTAAAFPVRDFRTQAGREAEPGAPEARSVGKPKAPATCNFPGSAAGRMSSNHQSPP